MNIKIFLGFWIFFAALGVFYITNSGVSYGSVTCFTGEIARSESLCPECTEDLHCADKGIDLVCNLAERKCEQKSCFSSAECSEGNICEFNRCVSELDLYSAVE